MYHVCERPGVLAVVKHLGGVIARDSKGPAWLQPSVTQGTTAGLQRAGKWGGDKEGSGNMDHSSIEMAEHR